MELENERIAGGDTSGMSGALSNGGTAAFTVAVSDGVTRTLGSDSSGTSNASASASAPAPAPASASASASACNSTVGAYSAPVGL